MTYFVIFKVSFNDLINNDIFLTFFLKLSPFVEIRQENGKDIIAGFMPEILRSIAEMMSLK